MPETNEHPSLQVTCCVCGVIVNGVGVVDWSEGQRRLYHQTCWIELFGPDRRPFVAGL